MKQEHRELLDRLRPARRVLVVDDHPSFRRCASTLLRPRGSRSWARPRTGRRRSRSPTSSSPSSSCSTSSSRTSTASRSPRGCSRATRELQIVLVSSRDRSDVRPADRDERRRGSSRRGSSPAARSRGCWSDGRLARPTETSPTPPPASHSGRARAPERTHGAGQPRPARRDPRPHLPLRPRRHVPGRSAGRRLGPTVRPGGAHRQQRPRRPPGRIARSVLACVVRRARHRQRELVEYELEIGGVVRRCEARMVPSGDGEVVAISATSRSSGARRRSSGGWRRAGGASPGGDDPGGRRPPRTSLSGGYGGVRRCSGSGPACFSGSRTREKRPSSASWASRPALSCSAASAPRGRGGTHVLRTGAPARSNYVDVRAGRSARCVRSDSTGASACRSSPA